MEDFHPRVEAEEDIEAGAHIEGGTVAEVEAGVVAGLGQAGYQQACHSTSVSSQSTEVSVRCRVFMFN